MLTQEYSHTKFKQQHEMPYGESKQFYQKNLLESIFFDHPAAIHLTDIYDFKSEHCLPYNDGLVPFRNDFRDDDSVLKVALNLEVSGKRKRGRPKKT